MYSAWTVNFYSSSVKNVAIDHVCAGYALVMDAFHLAANYNPELTVLHIFVFIYLKMD